MSSINFKRKKMKILFLSHNKWPRIGGVEKHVEGVRKYLVKGGHKVSVISKEDIHYPNIKFFGLFYIWFWFFKHNKIIRNHDVIHCHDIFIWYLPFRFLYPKRPVYITFHGWEGVWPVPWKNVFLKKLSLKFSKGSISIGRYIEKYYHIKATKVSYGSVSMIRAIGTKKRKNVVVFVGRLEKDTGVLAFLKWLEKNHGYKVDFCGDGVLRKECEKYGTVHGFCDPNPYYKKAKYCVPGGYLAALEGLSFGCELKLFWDTKLKEDYWKMSPFYKLKGKKLKEWARQQTWEKLADEYISLYNSKK